MILQEKKCCVETVGCAPKPLEHGVIDKAVPLDKNSQVLHERYRALSGPMELIIVPGKGHEAVPEFFQEPRMLGFLKTGALPAK